MIEIILNGQKKEIENQLPLESLIKALGLKSQWVVVELNGRALLKADYAQTVLKNGDHLELVRAVSGG